MLEDQKAKRKKKKKQQQQENIFTGPPVSTFIFSNKINHL